MKLIQDGINSIANEDLLGPSTSIPRSISQSMAPDTYF